ncbi:FAD-binding oxidoreductase [Actinomadura rugatobispora]|uniref:FAD-binding oxidoreductase n=1 Tax=Actinomadura rugatobispora TaxID=1994 RepID=A0ABW1AEL8_9ACTN
MNSTSTAVREVRAAFAGAVHLPGETGYDELRGTPFAPIDPRPALVAEATGADDVRAAVLAARDAGMGLTVQATGHGTHVPCDGGLLLRTSRMAGVLVDPHRRLARVGPGAVWGQVLAAAAPFGLAGLSGSHAGVGVTGYTLGGGLGWLSRAHGFAADSLLRARVVTADGRIVTASPGSHPDLYWALRGGGGNFGVVTAMEFRLHPVGQVFAGTACFPIERAAETLTRYRDWIDGAPDRLSTALLLTPMPDAPEAHPSVRGRRVLQLKAMYAGSADQARRLLRPLTRAAGPALTGDFRVLPYAEAAMGGTAPGQVELLGELPDAAIAAIVRAAEPSHGPAVEIRHWDGAMGRPGTGAGPAGHRSTRLSVIADTRSPALADALRPHSGGRAFLNFLHDPTRTADAYSGADHHRLATVKRHYDPDNTFGLTHNIAPAPPAAVRTAG